MDYLIEKEPDHSSQFLVNLKKEFDSNLSNNNAFPMNKIDLGKFPTLQGMQQLTASYLALGVQLLRMSWDIFFDETKTHEVLTADYLKSSLWLFYFFGKTLEGIFGRHKALEFYKSWVDLYARKYAPITPVPDLKYKLNRGVDWPPPFGKSFILTEFELEDGRVGMKIEKCKCHEVLKDLNDPEWAYAVTCHYDFPAATRMNPAFCLTRTQTLTQGKPYCDFVWHDTRKHEKPRHPKEDFWEGMV